MPPAPARFPLLTPEEFCNACRCFVRSLHGATAVTPSLSLRFVGSGHFHPPYVVVSKPLPAVTPPASGPSDHVADVREELDPEALPSFKPRPRVDYHIVLSPSYQVPVLYLDLAHVPPDASSDVGRLGALLVPELYRAQVEAVGVIGALSLTEHPVTGAPAYFVHPCNTASALSELAQGTHVGIELYIQLWLGLVGPCVGLNLPLPCPSPHQV